MVIQAKRFTPEVLLSAPRRGPAIPNHDGTLALYEVTTYSFDEHKTVKEIRILNIKTGASTLFTSDSEAHDALWLGDGTNSIIWLQSGAKGITNIMIGDGDEPTKMSYIVDVIMAPFSNLKVTQLLHGSIACAMTGLATPDGSLYNKETMEEPKSSARIYDKLFVRYWNRYITSERNVIWYSRLTKWDGKYFLAAPFSNALKGTDFECPFDSGIGNEASEFDISPAGILFNSWKRSDNPNIYPPAVYFVPLSSFEEETQSPQRIDTGEYTGITSNPRFSPCGKKAAFLITPSVKNCFESRILLVPDLSEGLHALEIWEFAGATTWSLSPSGFEWFPDGTGLYLTADDCGRVKLFSLSFFCLQNELGYLPCPLTQDGAVTAYYSLNGRQEKLLITTTSLVDNGTYSIVDIFEPESKLTISSSSKNGLKFGLDPKQVSEMWFEGDGDYCVQAWVVKPSFFDETKKYPLALLIHGGPQDGWREAWSTRWNPAVWAEQGYVCVMPNLTGSTGFGVDFTKNINDEWGGRPYVELENCFEYVEENMHFVDAENAIAAGGSYGGYMALWIQGNSLGRKLKAIVCHDGIFNTQSLLAGDIFDIKGGSNFKGSMLPWENYKNLEKFNPARHDLLANWKTPLLVIHSDLDYRCILSDGLAAFAVCQALGTPSKFLNFPDEGHWVLKPENSLVWHKTVFDWINRFSGIAKDDAELEGVGPAQRESMS